MKDCSKNFKYITTMLVVAITISAQNIANSYDYSYIDIAQAFENKPTAILLDTSSAERILPKANTSIPFNLRGFSEAEYFTSTIEDTPPVNQNSPPDMISVEGTSLAEKELSPSQNSPPETFTTVETATEFFTPPEKIQEAFCVENKPSFGSTNSQENIYTAQLYSENNSNNDIEGKQISNINIYGLKTLSPEYVKSQITTKKNSLFNSTILQQDLQKIYATGYFTDEMNVEPIVNNDGKIDLVFQLKENILVNDVNVVGCTIFSAKELEEFLEPLRNKPQNLIEINNAIEKINNLYHEKGYILAEVSSIDDDEHGGINLVITEGLIAKIEISGNEKTQDYVITRNILTAPGSVYNEECLRKDLAKVFSTQIFETVDRNIIPSETIDGAYDITVVVKEKSTNSVALGGGIDTGLGAFGSVNIKEENFLGKGQRITLGGILGSGILLSDASIKNHMNYQVELGFFEPYFLNADNSLSGKLFYRELGSFQVPLAIERRIGAHLGVEHKVQGYKNLSTSFTTGIEHINLKEGDYNRIAHLYNIRNLNISQRAKQLQGGTFFNLAPGIKYSTIDNIENPRDGFIAQARFTEAIGVSNFNHTHGRLSGAVTKFFPVLKKSSFSLTAKAGVKLHGDEMPEVMAYRLGGPYTIRGYRMNGVGTGESFLMGTAELATPLPFSDRVSWDFFKKMRLTFFVDAGKVFDPTVTNILFDRPEHAITAGIGLRVFIPGIGPISVDYGIPITNPGSYGSDHGYFTFGTGGMNGVYGYGY